ncbi:hypothetical protein MNEG_5261 [Monoraphidium neglectum]|uniref:FACT complex subunit SSRP1 n=1 Tax=Monoraphidium neglectum TaxID=145388 RepID=A0A0D2MQJ8_9CHLO|nr:hypothetical protein MNEG_5261 [Monoraphidium neglectum]KIZ02697.1 hypothetical protein MNEG_5261 [Monoraphidium neglectum]|eukprot:XP_013901716.1 hypothetical protein MNEG_5261 [Monoraphidium neglectum]
MTSPCGPQPAHAPPAGWRLLCTDRPLSVAALRRRGKHDIAFGSDHLLLRNSQRVVAVPYSAIQHVAILEQVPKEPKDKNCVVLALRRDSDIKAGKQRLDVIVAQTKVSPEVSVAVPPGCEQLASGPTLAGPAAVVLCQLLGAHIPDILDDTFTSSDPSVFKASSGDLAISANVRTASGWLFPLPGALLFLGKPAHFLRHSEIAGVEFARLGTSSTFDLTVHVRGGGRVEFGQVGQGEAPRLQAYVQERRLPVGPPDPSAAARPQAAAGSKRAASGGGPSAAAHGGTAAYGAPPGAAAGLDDEGSDEEDSDFDPEAADAAEQPHGGKRQRTGSAGAGTSGAGEEGEELGSDDSDEEDAEEDDDEDDDSSDVSLVATDDMSDGDGGEEDD